MLNNRTLFPALFKPAGGGGGGSGQTIQVTELPEAVLAEKDKIYQYTGSTTETLTNGYFYKCVEITETEGDVITVTYKWENIPVMEVEASGVTYSSTPHIIGKYNNQDLWEVTIFNPQTGSWNAWADSDSVSVNNIVTISGTFVDNNLAARNLTGANDGNINNVAYRQQYGIYIEVASGHSISRVNQVTIQYTK